MGGLGCVRTVAGDRPPYKRTQNYCGKYASFRIKSTKQKLEPETHPAKVLFFVVGGGGGGVDGGVVISLQMLKH